MATLEDCQELRAIEARLTVAAGAPNEKSARVIAELERHERNLAAVGGEESLERCTSEQPASAIDCARTAKTLVELESCTRK